MKTIWKYPLLPSCRAYPLPQGATIIAVGTQRTNDHHQRETWRSMCPPVMWVLVDPEQPVVPHLVGCVGTGHDLADDLAASRYIGVIQLDSGIVVHVFDGGEVSP